MGYAFSNTFEFIINTVLGIYIAILLLRFLLRFNRISFINPFAHFILKATDPLLKPIQKLLPKTSNIDSAALLAALLLHIAYIFIIAILDHQEINIINILLWSVVGLFTITLNMYIYILIISIIASWVPELQHQAIIQTISQLAEPVLKPFRSLLPNIGGIDFSPIVPFFLIQIILQFLHSVPMLRATYIIGL